MHINQYLEPTILSLMLLKLYLKQIQQYIGRGDCGRAPYTDIHTCNLHNTQSQRMSIYIDTTAIDTWKTEVSFTVSSYASTKHKKGRQNKCHSSHTASSEKDHF